MRSGCVLWAHRGSCWGEGLTSEHSDAHCMQTRQSARPVWGNPASRDGRVLGVRYQTAVWPQASHLTPLSLGFLVFLTQGKDKITHVKHTASARCIDILQNRMPVVSGSKLHRSELSPTWFTYIVCSCPVAKLCPTLLWPLWTIAFQAPLSMGFFQARILDWVAIFFSTISILPLNDILWNLIN